MFEKMEMFMEKQYEKVSAYPKDGKVFFDQAFGGLVFAIQMCGDDWDEADRLIHLWDDCWRPKFVKAVYDHEGV